MIHTIAPQVNSKTGELLTELQVADIKRQEQGGMFEGPQDGYKMSEPIMHSSQRESSML